MKKIAFITCRELPEPDFDEELLLSAVRESGVHAELLAWDDPEADPAPFDLCVFRSCWNYHESPGYFLDWTERVRRVTRLVNPPHIVRWNLHKHYLSGLEEAGIPIVPTAWFERGAVVNLVEVMEAHGWDDVVVKPSISAVSFRTRRFPAGEAGAGQEFLESLIQDRDLMVQKYMPAVEGDGERALIWIDGELTHAVSKTPRFADGIENVSNALPVTLEEKSIAERIVSHAAEELLYARIDVMRDENGAGLLSEFELIEPSLFLLQNPEALVRFVDAIRRW